MCDGIADGAVARNSSCARQDSLGDNRMDMQVMSSGGQSGTLRHEPIILADGRRVTHSVTSTEDGRIVGHLSRMADLKDLKRDGSGARYAAVRLNYTVSKDRDSMVLDGNSVAYVDMSGEAPEFVNLERIEKNARRVLILSVGIA